MKIRLKSNCKVIVSFDVFKKMKKFTINQQILDYNLDNLRSQETVNFSYY